MKLNIQYAKQLFVAALVFFSINSYGQLLEPVKWVFSEEKVSEDEYILTFTAKIEDEWTVYSQHTSEGGPVPTTITYEKSEAVDFLGKNVESGHKKEGFDKMFNIDVVKFLGDKDYVIKQRVKKKGEGPVSGYLTFMTCNDKTCLPPTDVDFSFALKGSSGDKSKASSEKKNDKSSSSVTPQASETKDIAQSAAVVKKSEPAPSFQVNTGDVQQSSGILDPVKWAWTYDKQEDGSYLAQYTATIEKGWTVYSQHTGEDGPVPTSITYTNEGDLASIGTAEESGYKKKGPDPYFDNVVVVKYLSDKPFTLTQKLKLKEGVSKDIEGYLTYMACNDKTCLPPTDVDFSFPTGSGKTSSENTMSLATTTVDGKVDQKRKELIETFNNPSGGCGDGSSSENRKSLLWLFFAGILGGFAALLTPCVFPMIPITVSFFTKDTKRKGWMNGLIYAISIIVIYVILGLLITVLLGPEALNALSTSWIANVLFFIIFIVFAFSFFGFYEITLPSSWTTKTDTMADKGGLLGIFFMATTLALVSFSCTGPIVGSALVAAANGGIIGPLVVMLGFSIALSLPFGLFAAFPAWLNSLPKSGSWMNSVKVVLGFLEVGFAFKFLSTADLTQHWGFLRYELFMLILIVVCILIALYLFGFIKFPHDSPIKKLSTMRKSIATIFGLLAVYLCFGFTKNPDTGIYNSLWLTSGFSPPVNYNYFLEKGKLNESIAAKYPSYTKCANNIDCFKDYFEGMEYARESGKPGFVDFTGHGCQNCRRTEDNIWVDDKVRKMLNDDVVLISLYVDDRTPLEKPFVSIQDDKKKRTVGAKWADFQVVNFQQNSQPLYIMVTPDEQVITTPRGYEDGIEEYADYLSCGIDWFKTNWKK